MKKKIYILGTTDFSFMIHQMIDQEEEMEIVGHVVSQSDYSKNIEKCKMHNTKLYPLEDLESQSQNINILNTIGYTCMNKIRENITEECMRRNYQVVEYISRRAIVLSENRGMGNIVLPGAYIGTGIKMGDGNIFYAGCVFTHDISIGNYNFFAANGTYGGFISIGNNCFVGMGAVVKNRVSMGHSVLVGAGTYVSHDVKDEEVIVTPSAIVLEKKSSEINI